MVYAHPNETMNSTPFTEKSQLLDKFPSASSGGSANARSQSSVPNKLSISLTNTAGIADFLKQELVCTTLDELHPHLHYVARRSSASINAIHEHLLRGRTVKLTEDPGLHLVWYYKELYLKPMPHCLLSFSFWEKYLAKSQQEVVDKSSLRPAALGFVRSYAYLIRHESDFAIAQQNKLLPDALLYHDFQGFIDPFRAIPDDAVSPRWEFGQLRLTRLNWAVRLLQPPSRRGRGGLERLYYQQVYWQTGQFLETFVTPLLFLFGTFSVILSAMQVALAAHFDPWKAFNKISEGFSVAVIVLLAALFLIIIMIVAVVLVSQFCFAWRSQRRPKCSSPT